MEGPKSFKPYMQAYFTKAKRFLWWSEAVGVGVGGLAIVAVFIPTDPSWASWALAVCSFVLLAVQQVLGIVFRDWYEKAEAVRRRYLVTDGLGLEVSPQEYKRLEAEVGSPPDDGKPYYTSRFSASPARLLMLTWESAFWSEDLQKRLVGRFAARSLVALVVSVVAVLLILRGDEGDVAAQLIPPSLALVMSLNLGGKWYSASQAHRECKDVCTKCEDRIRRNIREEAEEDEVAEVMQMVLDQAAVMLTAYPVPDAEKKKQEQRLDKAWQETEAWAATTEWGKQEGQEP